MLLSRLLINGAAGLLPALVLFFFLTPNAHASWQLDPARFHVSAHGQTPCLDCHGNVADQQLHPKPGNVNKHEAAFFKPDQCLDCHDQVMGNLDKGVHGSLKVKNAGEYGACLKCHNPHTQPSLGENRAGKYNPDRPPREQCGACHKMASALPSFSDEDAACMNCHQAPSEKDPEDVKRDQAFCLHCHGNNGTEAQIKTGKHTPLMNAKTYAATPHAQLACTDCHEKAAAFGHNRQPAVDCLKCHPPHDEAVTHDAHVGVACQACHLKGITPFRDTEKAPLLFRPKKIKDLSTLHQMKIDGEVSCKRCHFAGNDLGAASMVLPAKSIVCMPCHTATFTLTFTLKSISTLGLMVFLFGMVLFISVLLTGTMNHISSTHPMLKLLQALFDSLRTIFSPKIFKILQSLFWDAFLQRRLYRRSPGRWFIHGLIFYPFVIRFSFGLAALLGSIWAPENPFIRDMINKNYPLTAFLYDLTGIMMLTGVILAWIRGALQERNRTAGIPSQDRIALALIGGIVIIGFLLEGIRIVMTGYPENAAWSFIGYAISLWFSPSRGIPEVFSFMWYIHAALTAAFIAYIPFSRLLHMILAPVVISINANSPAHGAHNEDHKAENRDFGF
jgi:nitrate reductase gamma subunit